ncbi:hypothetical protein SL003B_3088 [Polymorphum gilvum SL003B-26A1]|uniref:Uncharacterized protein n=1 Tax=Polymorphum gilvum (strain LMG 25793 / CGMCC 1.9160 / SL003B-26A1) TaxID=991905 RepID=F2IWT4_POLGS|nr:hypothetical protein SL003B_3088 [Polymorphum gilvum SL003B-26A1]
MSPHRLVFIPFARAAGQIGRQCCHWPAPSRQEPTAGPPPQADLALPVGRPHAGAAAMPADVVRRETPTLAFLAPRPRGLRQRDMERSGTGYDRSSTDSRRHIDCSFVTVS